MASLSVAAGMTLASIKILMMKRKTVTPTSNTRRAIINGFFKFFIFTTPVGYNRGYFIIFFFKYQHFFIYVIRKKVFL